VFGGIHKNRVIRTGLRAGFAPDTASAIKIYDAVISFIQRSYRTDFDTRSISTMIATHHAKQSPRIGKLAFFDVFYPRPIYSDGNLMLRFARNCASVATDTFSIIYDETKIHLFLKIFD
jgi:hypothetical protein